MFKFIRDDENHRVEISIEESDITHVELAEWFNQFLRGCGYIYDGEYALVGPEEETVLARYEREKARDAFIQSAFEGDLNDNKAGSTFPVI